MEKNTVLRPTLAVLLLAVMFTLTGCGGGGGGFGDDGAGVSNGGILGTIRGVGSLGTLPIEGAFVTVSRETFPNIIRTTTTDANGDFAFSDLPTGPYSVEVSANGFVPRSLGTAVFVEPGTFSQLGPIVLEGTLGFGNSNLVVTVLDEVTGDPISNATVTAGVASTSRGSSGVYSLAVPVSTQGTTAPVVGLSVQAAGYDDATLSPRTVTIVPGRMVSVTARLRPFAASIAGRVRIGEFPGIFLSSGALSTVTVQIPNVDPAFGRGVINPSTGEFVINVPASTRTLTRTFSLTFISPLFNIAIVPNVIAPAGGQRTLGADVVLTPIRNAVSGSVLTASGTFPGGSAADSATISELGVTVPVIAGRYEFPNVPVGIPLTMKISVFDPIAGRVQRATIPFTPVTNDQGVFVLPTVTTQ